MQVNGKNTLPPWSSLPIYWRKDFSVLVESSFYPQIAFLFLFMPCLNENWIYEAV